MSDTCNCGSGQYKYALYDGYGIFLTYVCDKCEDERRKKFRLDIMEQYDHDELLEENE